MSAIKDGGPAFPEAIAIGPAGDVYPGMGGMSLRDWFAGQALNGICAGVCASSNIGARAFDRVDITGAAKDAYTIADAMLKAREVQS